MITIDLKFLGARSEAVARFEINGVPQFCYADGRNGVEAASNCLKKIIKKAGPGHEYIIQPNGVKGKF